MYELARGPLMWLAAIIFCAGVAYRAVQLFRLTRKKPAGSYAGSAGKGAASRYSEEERKLERIAAFHARRGLRRWDRSRLGRHAGLLWQRVGHRPSEFGWFRGGGFRVSGGG